MLTSAAARRSVARRWLGRTAATAGFCDSPRGKHPRLQIITVQDLLDGKGIDYPRGSANVTTRRAARHERSRATR